MILFYSVITGVIALSLAILALYAHMSRKADAAGLGLYVAHEHADRHYGDSGWASDLMASLEVTKTRPRLVYSRKEVQEARLVVDAIYEYRAMRMRMVA